MTDDSTSTCVVVTDRHTGLVRLVLFASTVHAAVFTGLSSMNFAIGQVGQPATTYHVPPSGPVMASHHLPRTGLPVTSHG